MADEWPDDYPSDLPKLTCAELDALIVADVAIIQADIDAWDERAAIRAEAFDDGKTTDERAYEALQRDERFPGEHAVASAWLREHAHVIWERM